MSANPGAAQQRELTDEEVFGAPTPAPVAAPAPSLAQRVVGPAPTPAPIAVPAAPREFTDEEVFGQQAAPPAPQPTSLGERFKVNAQEGLDNSLLGEVRAQGQSGRFEERAADTLRAEIERQRYMLQNLGPQMTPEARAAAERDIAAMEEKVGGLQYDAAAKRPAFEAEEAQKAQRAAAVTPWTQEPGMVNKAVAGITALIGQLIGGAPSPENFIGGSGGKAIATGAKGVAEKFGRGFVANAPVAATANVATQTMQEDRGARDEFSVLDMLLAGGAGGTIGGTIHAGPEAASQIWSLVRGKLAGLRGVAPDAVTPGSVTAADAEALRLDPEVKAALDQFGATPSTPESAQAMADRIARRREQDAQGRSDLTTDDVPRYRGAADNVRADAEAVVSGEVDRGAAAPPPARTEPPPVIVPERAVDQGTQAGVDLRGKSNLPAVVERQPERLTPEDVTRARADMEGGQPQGAAVDDMRPRADTNMTAPPGRAPQTPDDVQAQREAAQAFSLKERQDARAGEGVADTQPAGRPEGFGAKTVHLDEGFPVEIVSRRMVPDARGNMVDVATVRRYDPRTGKAEPDAVEYEVPARQLKTKQYAAEPRQAQDFRERAESPAGEKFGLPEQTYRKTPPDTNEQFPGASSGGRGEPPTGRGPHEGRSPYPEQPEGPHPGPQRATTEEELIRRAQQRDREQTQSGGTREQARPEDNQASSREKGKDRDGHWVVDDRGFVVSDKGGPIRFGDHKQAAKWIINVGQKQPSRQWFEIANHPSGKGYTARELGRTKPDEPSPGGRDEAPPTRANQQALAEQRRLRDLEAENEAIQRTHSDTSEGGRGASGPESAGKPAEGDGVHRGSRERGGLDEGRGGSEGSGGAGGSTLFAGAEGKAIAEAASLVSRATGGLAATIRENWNVALKNLTSGGRPKSPRGALKDIAQTLAYSNDGYLRSLAKDYKSPTITKVADMFFARSGGADSTARTYGEAVVQHTQRRFNQLEEILGPFGKNEKDLNRITELVQKPGLIKDGTSLGDAARKLQALLKDELKYAREAGIDMGEIKSGYFPREINREMVQLDPEGFTAAAKRVYQKMGVDPKEAAALADHWRQTIIAGDMGTKVGGNDFIAIAGAMPTPKNVRARELPKQADDILRPFLLQNPADVLSSYFTRMARRAEWARRMGDDLSKWKELKQAMIDEGATAAVPDVVKHIQSITGTMPVSIGHTAKNALSLVQVWTTLGLLPKATIASLAEPMLAGIRSGNAPAMLRSYITSIKSIAKTKSTQELRDLAEDLGVIGQVGHDLLMAQRFGGVSDSKAAQYVTNQFFLRTGLHQFTEATRVASLGVGQMFIRRLALDVANERPRAASSRLLLKEMGVPDGELKAFAEWVKRADDGKPTRADLAADDGHSATYRTAIARFVDHTIMNTKAVERPYYANHPVGRMAYNLMSYLYSFQKNVLNRSGNMAKMAVTEKGLTLADRATLAAPLMMLPTLLGANFAISEAREAVLGDPTRKRDMTDRFMLALSRSSLTGVADWLVNMYQGVRYERDPATALAGPGPGRILDGLKSFVELTNSKNSPNTNAAERQFAKAVYDLVVEPGANFLFSVQPIPYVGAAGIQAVSSGTAREAFVSAVAGEKPPERTKARM